MRLASAGKLLRLQADQKKSGRGIFSLQDVEDLWRVCGVGAIVKREGHLFFFPAISLDLVRLRQHRHLFRDNKFLVRIKRDLALAGAGLVLDIQDLAIAFTINVFTGRDD